nr:glutathione transferase GstA [uncultured Gellertiella sp.]
MKLYYSPGACSLSPHIVLKESGIAFDAVKVDLRAHETEAGADYYRINPKGAVPAIELEDGSVLTEGAAIVQFIADRHAPALAPANGTVARARLQEMLNYIAAEYHKSFSPLFNPALSDEAKDAQRQVIARKQAYFEGQLADGRPYILGQDFTVADAYLFTVTGWSAHTGVSLEAFPHLAAHHARVAGRPAVQAALKAEGLM